MYGRLFHKKMFIKNTHHASAWELVSILSSQGSREMGWLKLSPKERKKLKRIAREREEQLVAKKRVWVKKHLTAMDEALWGQTSHPLTGIWDSDLKNIVREHLVVIAPRSRLGAVKISFSFYIR